MSYLKLRNGFLSPSMQQGYLPQDVTCTYAMKDIQTNALEAVKIMKRDPILSNAKEKAPIRFFFFTGLAELELWLQKTTSTAIEQAIISLVSAFRNNREFNRPDNLPEEVSDAVRQQQELGLDCFLCGFLTKQWRSAQKVYINDSRS